MIKFSSKLYTVGMCKAPTPFVLTRLLIGLEELSREILSITITIQKNKR